MWTSDDGRCYTVKLITGDVRAIGAWLPRPLAVSLVYMDPPFGLRIPSCDWDTPNNRLSVAGSKKRGCVWSWFL